jgi:hypothetical protein
VETSQQRSRAGAHVLGASRGSNSLFLSHSGPSNTMPSAVLEIDVSADSNDILLDITSATNESVGARPLPPAAGAGAGPGAGQATRRGGALAAYKAAVDPVRLEDARHRVTARVALSAVAQPLGGTSAPERRRRAAVLERLRDRSDSLLYTHGRRAAARGGPVLLHADRIAAGGRLAGMVDRLTAPAPLEDVLQRAAALGRGQGDGPDGECAAALRGISWPSSTPSAARLAAEAAHLAALDGVGPGRRWWDVAHPDTGARADIRDVNASTPWPWDAKGLIGGGGRVGPLPAHAKVPHPVILRGPTDLVALATEGVFEGAEGTPLPPPRPLHAFEGYGEGAAPGSGRPSPLTLPPSSSAASDWWLSYVAAPLPLYSQVDVAATVGADAAQTAAIGTPFLAALHACVTQGQRGTYGAPGRADAAVPTFDCTLAAAATSLGVIDPWSTAAAFLDPSAVNEAVRSASAAVARLEAGPVGGSAEAAPSGGVPGVEELLDMTAELACAPAFDFYSAVRGLGRAGQDARINGLREGGAAAAHDSAARRTEAGLSSPLALPAMAEPGEPLSRRVQAAYTALKRRVEAADAIDLAPPTPAATSGATLGGSLAGLARIVAARRIAHVWRGKARVAAARREAERRRAGAGMLSPAVQSAVAHLVSVLGGVPGASAPSAQLAGQHQLFSALKRAAPSSILRHGTSATPTAYLRYGSAEAPLASRSSALAPPPPVSVSRGPLASYSTFLPLHGSSTYETPRSGSRTGLVHTGSAFAMMALDSVPA